MHTDAHGSKPEEKADLASQDRALMGESLFRFQNFSASVFICG